MTAGGEQDRGDVNSRTTDSLTHRLEGMIMHNSKRTRGWTIVALAAVLIGGFGVGPAAARQGAAAPVVQSTQQAAPVMDSWLCPLTRIGSQFVRCDVLTGAGVFAPAWVAEG